MPTAAPYVRLNTQVLLATTDISAASVTADTTPNTVVQVNVTTLGSGGFRLIAPGVRQSGAHVTGYADLSSVTAVSNVLFPLVGTQSTIVINELTLPGLSVAGGTPSWMSRGIITDVKAWGGNEGAAAMFEVSLGADTASLLGQVAMPLQALTVAGFTGSVLTIAGPTATQKLYGVVQTTAAAGTNLVVTVQSAAAIGFASPTTRLTFSTVAGGGVNSWLWATPVAGPITDGFWRVSATVATSTFTAACSIGVI